MKKITHLLWLLFVLFSMPLTGQENPDPNRFNEEIENFRRWDAKNSIPKDFVLFVGSSSIRMWKTTEFFPDLAIVNRGFGGAHISDMLFFKDDILLKYPTPSCIVMFCGGNDIASGKSAEQVTQDFEKWWGIIQDNFPETPLIFIPIKPCPSRWNIWNEEQKVNKKVEKISKSEKLLFYADIATPMLQTGQPPADDLFIDDKLHMSEKGYQMWTAVVQPLIELARKKKYSDKVLYEELVPTDFRKRVADSPIAYLPLGTLEWHGEHLPLGSDGLQVKHFFEILAKNVGGVVMPMLYLGPDGRQVVENIEYFGMDRGNFIKDEKQQYPRQKFDGSAYWVSDSVFNLWIDSTFKQLARAGFKIVVAHGHGPSTIFVQQHADEFGKKYHLKIFNCWSEQDAEGLGIMVDHAAMNETSLVMALRPELVHMEYLPADTSQWPAGVGGKDPRLFASSELGWKAINLQKERMINLLTHEKEKLKN